MKEFLNKIRVPDENTTMKSKIVNTILIFLLGIILGLFSKWLDNLSINDEIWWQHFIGILDLGNVFSYFGIWIFLATTYNYRYFIIAFCIPTNKSQYRCY